jgi:hypothetical protein
VPRSGPSFLSGISLIWSTACGKSTGNRQLCPTLGIRAFFCHSTKTTESGGFNAPYGVTLLATIGFRLGDKVATATDGFVFNHDRDKSVFSAAVFTLPHIRRSDWLYAFSKAHSSSPLMSLGEVVKLNLCKIMN